jgi:RNA polymerase sigma-70 factor (ECF subfamily)
MSDEMPDILLVQRTQAGDKPAYEELIRRYARLVWSVVYGIVRDPGWTESVVQDTFLKGWQAIGSLREPAAFRGWLATIARNNAFRYNNASAKINDALSDINAQGDAAKPQTEPNDQRARLHQALTELPERYRVPITLRYLEGFSYNEIAQNLGLTDGSLRGLLNRGMKLLRETMSVNE